MRTVLGLALVLWWGVCGCGIGFGGGEAGMITPQQEENPQLQGTLEGRIEVDSWFLPHLLAVMRGKGDGKVGSTGSVKDLYKRIEVGIVGTRRVAREEVQKDGTFRFKGLHEGAYRVSAYVDGRAVVRQDVEVVRRSTVSVRLVAMGFAEEGAPSALSSAPAEAGVPADGAGAGEETGWGRIVFEKELSFRGQDTEFVRRFLLGGMQITRLPDGSVEHYGRGGLVRTQRPDGSVVWRLDQDNDFVPDEEEREPPRAEALEFPPNEDPVAPRRAPMLLSVDVTNVGRPKAGSHVEPGDLLLVQAETCDCRSEAVVEVVATLRACDGQSYAIHLRDDGSEKDLIERWPGYQISGDEAAGDGRFAYLLPIDSVMRKLLYNSRITFRARSRAGLESLPRTVFLHGKAGEADEPTAAVPLVSRLRGFSFQVRREKERVWLAAVFEAGHELGPLLSATLYGPQGLRRMFAVGSSGGRDGWLQCKTSPVLLEETGIYVAVAALKSGQIFYAGLPVRDLESLGRGAPKRSR